MKRYFFGIKKLKDILYLFNNY